MELFAYTTWGYRVCAWSYSAASLSFVNDFDISTGQVIQSQPRRGYSSTSYHRAEQIYKPSFESPVSYVHYGQSTGLVSLDAQLNTYTGLSSLGAYVHVYGEDNNLYSFVISSSTLTIKKAPVNDLAASTTAVSTPISSIGNANYVYAACYIGGKNIIFFTYDSGSTSTTFNSHIYNTDTNTVTNIVSKGNIGSLVGERHGITARIGAYTGQAFKIGNKIYIRSIYEQTSYVAWHVYDINQKTMNIASNGSFTGNNNFGYRTVCNVGDTVIVGPTRESGSMEITTFTK